MIALTKRSGDSFEWGRKRQYLIRKISILGATMDLKWGRGEPVSTTQYVLYAVQIAAVIILSYLSVVLLGPLSYSGISLFYFVYPFFLVFTMWWGIWGILEHTSAAS